MPVDIEDLLALLGQLCDDEGIRIAVKETVKGGLLTGAAAMVGGLLLGPPGLGLGGTLGGLASWYMTHGKFQPVSAFITNMDADKKKILYDDAMKVVRHLSINDTANLTALARGDEAVRKKLVVCTVDYLHKNMSIETATTSD